MLELAFVVKSLWSMLKGATLSLWGFVTSWPLWVWLTIGALATGLWWGEHRFSAGIEQAEARHSAIELKLQKRIADEKARSAIVTTRVVTQVEYRTRIVRERGATIVKEVPTYVPLDSCPLPGGFRVLHDAAAAGVLPDAARIPFAAPVPAQVAAATVAGNYAAYHETAETYCGLMAFGTAHGWPVPRDGVELCEARGWELPKDIVLTTHVTSPGGGP